MVWPLVVRSVLICGMCFCGSGFSNADSLHIANLEAGSFECVPTASRARSDGVRKAEGAPDQLDLRSSLQIKSDARDPLKLPSFEEVGRRLLKKGRYNGIIDAVIDCTTVPKGFIVIDSPSGSGKTQAAIALKQLDFTMNADISTTEAYIGQRKFRVAHLVWVNAVQAQKIYEEHVTRQEINEGLLNGMFFVQCRTFARMYQGKTMEELGKHVIWRDLVQYLFEASPRIHRFDLNAFQVKHKLVNATLVLFLDEFPSDPAAVQDMIVVREALRSLHGVVLIIAGTAANAGNAVTLQLGYGTSLGLDEEVKPWSIIITRLPAFDSECSPILQEQLQAIDAALDNSYRPDLAAANYAIRTSIANRGNPRLIIFSVRSLYDVVSASHGTKVLSASPGTQWQQWQRGFCEKVTLNKSVVTNSLSDASFGLISQVNLLSEATSREQLSDATLAAHYAFRAIPDCAFGCSGQDISDLAQCGGWLYIASYKQRIYGRRLQFRAGAVKMDMGLDGRTDWQTSIFAPFDRDPLVYLGACRDSGYFSVVEGTGTHNAKTVLTEPAHSAVLSLWGKNSASLINFQNPYALCNTGALLEVMTSISICNAAARTEDERIELTEFFGKLMRELGLPVSLEDIATKLAADTAFPGLQLPRCVFPGADLPDALDGFVALIRRLPNAAQYDLLVKGLKGRIATLRAEAKDRDNVDTRTLAKAMKNVCAEDGAMGVMVVRNCNQYWGEGHTNLEKLKAELEKVPEPTQDEEDNLANLEAQPEPDPLSGKRSRPAVVPTSGSPQKVKRAKGSKTSKAAEELHIGQIHFFSKVGSYAHLDLGNGKKGRVILIQVPSAVVGR